MSSPVGVAVLAGILALSACSRGGAPKAAKPKSVDDLLSDVSRASDENLRIAAANQLARSHDPRAIDAAIQALESQSVRVRIAAASGLGDAKQIKAIEPLWIALTDPAQAESFKFPAARALANLDDPRALPALLDSMAAFPEEARVTLIEMGKPAVPLLIKALGQPTARENASNVLLAMGAPAVEPLVTAMRNKEESRPVQLGAMAVLSDLPTPGAQAALAEILRQPSLDTTVAAYRYLIRSGRAEHEPRLIGALQTSGTPSMAENFASSGNLSLREAAKKWAEAKQYHLGSSSAAKNPVEWGGGAEQSVSSLGLYHFDTGLTSTSGVIPIQADGVSLIPGRWGTAVSVGKGGNLRYPLKDNLNLKEGTIEMWISPKVDGSAAAFIGINNALVMYQAKEGLFTLSAAASGGFYAGTHMGNQLKFVSGGATQLWRAGKWHHIAFTYSGLHARLRLYIDGALISESATGLFPLTPDAPGFSVGCDAWGAWSAFSIDELQISAGEKTRDAIRSTFLNDGPLPDR